MSADETSWTLAEPLGYGKTYTVTGTATGTDGKSVPIQGTYTTVTPVDQITTSISPATATWSGWPRRSSCTSATNRPTGR